MLFFDGRGKWSTGRYRNRRAKEELRRLNRFGSKADFEKIVRSFDMLLFKAADAKIEIDCPGAVDDSCQVLPEIEKCIFIET